MLSANVILHPPPPALAISLRPCCQLHRLYSHVQDCKSLNNFLDIKFLVYFCKATFFIIKPLVFSHILFQLSWANVQLQID